jgi:hypothetical protein
MRMTKKTKTMAKMPNNALLFFVAVTKTPFFEEPNMSSIFSKTKGKVNKL